MAHVAKRRKLLNGNPLPFETTAPEPSAENAVAETTNSTDIKDQRRSLFVRSLPKTVTTEELAEHFSQSFPLKHAIVVLDKETGLSRGFGFVTFTDADDAQNAVAEFNDSVIGGRKIKVEIAAARNREVDDNLAAVGRTTTKNSVNTTGQELRAKRQEQQQEDKGVPPKLIVRNLPWSVKTSDDLAKLFLSYGKVKHAVVPKLAQKGKNDAHPHQQAGFGIVILRGRKNAEKALQGMNGKEVDGRVLAVDWAVDRETWEKAKGKEDSNGADEHEADVEAAVNSKTDDVESDTSSEGSESEDDLIGDIDDQDQDMSLDGDDDAGAGVDGSLSSAVSDVSDDVDANQHNSNDENTIFIRNLPFTADDDSLYSHFKSNFGPVRYARVVYDHETNRSRGTAFVCFYDEDVARECVKNAPQRETPSSANQNRDDKKRKGESMAHSLLQNETDDPSGKYTLEDRVLQIVRALPKNEADRRAKESSQKRSDDKRRLFLLSEGTIPAGSSLYNLLGKTELGIRESSAKQRQKLVKENPNLGLSLTRLSVRNIPRSIDSKELKALARQAVVGFATDVKAGKRQPLSREEVNRGGMADREAERARREKGRGVVKQVKVVYESEKTGGKVGEGKGGRSRGYGFIEYHNHRNALMGLRWLNGHLIRASQQKSGGEKQPKNAEGGGEIESRNKRLIVEFAIENAQVVQRRSDRENRARSGGAGAGGGTAPLDRDSNKKKNEGPGQKRKRDRDDNDNDNDVSSSATRKTSKKSGTETVPTEEVTMDQDKKNKIAARNRIIAQKRQKRKKGRKGQ